MLLNPVSELLDVPTATEIIFVAVHGRDATENDFVAVLGGAPAVNGLVPELVGAPVTSSALCDGPTSTENGCAAVVGLLDGLAEAGFEAVSN